MRTAIAPRLALLTTLFLPAILPAADWPTYRYDPQRRASSPEVLADQLHLQWTRELPPLTPAWPDQPKMQFDVAYNPVVAGQRLFLASSKHDWVAAFDTRSGKELWRFFAEGPTRFAPLVSKDKVYFVSDDGCLYCLDAAKGTLRWKHRGGPSDRKILGNERLVSSWPARGAPVLVDDTIYYGASIWPFMGIFIHALDADTGKVDWTNDGEGTNYIKQPHNADSFATVAPQGHLTVIGDRLLIPGGRSIPALFDRLTGKLLKYQLAENGKRGGGSDVTAAGPYFFNGGAVFDLVSQKHLAEIGNPMAVSGEHLVAYAKGALRVYDFRKVAPPKEVETVDAKGKVTKTTKWSIKELASVKTPAVTDLILAGGRIYAVGAGEVRCFEIDEAAREIHATWRREVKGDPVGLIAADERLFVVTREGVLSCFGATAVEPVQHKLSRVVVETPVDGWSDRVSTILKETEEVRGYALVWHIGSGRLIRELHRQSKMHIVVVEPNADKALAFRSQLAAEDMDRIQVLTADPGACPLPPYLATLIATEETSLKGLSPAVLAKWFNCLRPYGGSMALPDAPGLSQIVRDAKLIGADTEQAGKWCFIHRPEGLPGAANWTHEHGDASNTRVSRDVLVKAPLGVLWFGGPPNDAILPRHGHGPQPQVVDGRLIIEGVDVIRAIDIYTGRLLWETRLPGVGYFYNNLAHQPGANASGSNFVSTRDGIYVAWRDKCIRLNLDDGKIEQTFVLPAAKGKASGPLWGYINVHGDYLIAGVDPILDPKNLPPDPKVVGPDFGADKDPKEKEKNDIITKLIKSIKAFNDNMSASKRLVVLDRKTGKVLWSVEAECWFRHNGTILSKDRLFTIDRLSGEQLDRYKRKGEDPPFPTRLRVFDLASGKELWSTPEDVFGTWLSYSEKHDILLESGRNGRDTIPDEPKGMRAYNATTGKVLWFDKGYTGPAMILGDEVLQGQGACDIKTGKQKMRRDPITGALTPWTWIRNYGCNTPAASEHLLTFRSGAAGFFDLCNDGGTGNIGGFRSSCTNNLIVAGGILTVPDYTRTCTCAYQNQTSVALIHMPEAEMWTFFGTKEVKGAVKRLGLNFGAPGDRRADDGTLWLEYPSTAGTSPAVAVKTRPAKLDSFRRHSAAVEGDLPWVTASGVKGLEQLTLTLDKFAAGPKKYTVRLYFAEPDDLMPGQRVFAVQLQDKTVIAALDVVKEAGGPRRSLVREFKDVAAHDELFLRLTPARGSPVPSAILGGLEIIVEE